MFGMNSMMNRVNDLTAEIKNIPESCASVRSFSDIALINTELDLLLRKIELLKVKIVELERKSIYPL